jgi:hypothetical protein
MTSVLVQWYRSRVIENIPVGHEAGKSRMAIASEELDLVRHVAHKCPLAQSENKKNGLIISGDGSEASMRGM